VEGDSGRETGREEGGRCMGGVRRGDGQRDPKVAGSGRKRGKLRNRKNAKRREPKITGWEPGVCMEDVLFYSFIILREHLPLAFKDGGS